MDSAQTGRDMIKYDSLSVAQHLRVPETKSVNHGDDLRVLLEVRLLLLRNKCPKLVQVDSCAPINVPGQVEVTHTNFTEVTRMVLIKVGS